MQVLNARWEPVTLCCDGMAAVITGYEVQYGSVLETEVTSTTVGADASSVSIPVDDGYYRWRVRALSDLAPSQWTGFAYAHAAEAGSNIPRGLLLERPGEASQAGTPNLSYTGDCVKEQGTFGYGFEWCARYPDGPLTRQSRAYGGTSTPPHDPDGYNVMSAYIRMNDGGAPVPGRGDTVGHDFAMIVVGATAQGDDLGVKHIVNDLYKVTGRMGPRASGSAGIYQEATNSGRGFRMAGLSQETGAGRASMLMAPQAAGSQTLPTRPIETASAELSAIPQLQGLSITNNICVQFTCHLDSDWYDENNAYSAHGLFVIQARATTNVLDCYLQGANPNIYVRSRVAGVSTTKGGGAVPVGPVDVRIRRTSEDFSIWINRVKATVSPGQADWSEPLERITLNRELNNNWGMQVAQNIRIHPGTLTDAEILAWDPQQVAWNRTPTLPSGRVGDAYVADVGKDASHWTSISLATGTLPAGLVLNARAGTITGTPTAENAGAALTFTAHGYGTATSGTATLVIAAGATPEARINHDFKTRTIGDITHTRTGAVVGSLPGGNYEVYPSTVPAYGHSSTGPTNTGRELGLQINPLREHLTTNNTDFSSGSGWQLDYGTRGTGEGDASPITGAPTMRLKSRAGQTRCPYIYSRATPLVAGQTYWGRIVVKGSSTAPWGQIWARANYGDGSYINIHMESGGYGERSGFGNEDYWVIRRCDGWREIIFRFVSPVTNADSGFGWAWMDDDYSGRMPSNTDYLQDGTEYHDIAIFDFSAGDVPAPLVVTGETLGLTTEASTVAIFSNFEGMPATIDGDFGMRLVFTPFSRVGFMTYLTTLFEFTGTSGISLRCYSRGTAASNPYNEFALLINQDGQSSERIDVPYVYLANGHQCVVLVRFVGRTMEINFGGANRRNGADAGWHTRTIAFDHAAVDACHLGYRTSYTDRHLSGWLEQVRIEPGTFSRAQIEAWS